MGDNIKKLLAKFDEGLSLAISKQEENDKTFKSTRDSAIKIADARIGIWPSDASVKTIGDLLGYVFPISGGVKNEPTMTYPTGGMTPEGDGYQQDMKSSEEIKKTYNNLNKYYNTAAKYSLPKLKEKGGGQFWFDYYMYYLIDFYLKNAEFVKLVKTDFEGPGEMSKLMTGDGSSIKHYSNFETFDETIVLDSKYNSNKGLHRYITYNAAAAIVKDAADDLLWQAIIEAGDSYTGPYTNDIKASKKSLVELLEIIPPEEKKEEKPVVPEVKPVVPEVKPVVPTDNGVVKLKISLRGIQDGLQIKAKSDIPRFSIYAGDPDKDWPLLGAGEITEYDDDFEDVDGAELDEEYSETGYGGEEEFFKSLLPNGPEEGLKLADFKEDIIVYDELDTSTSTSTPTKQIGGSTKRANEKYAVPYGLTVTTVAQAKSSAYKALLEYADLGTEMYYSGARIGNKQKLKNPDGILESVFMSELTFVKNLTWKDKNGTIYKGGSGTKFHKSWTKIGLEIHKAARPGIENAYQQILKEYGLDKMFDLGLNTSAGSYYPRAMRGGTTPSLHSWAIAIDICAGENGLYDHCPKALFCKSDYKKFIDIMEANGWYSLGRSWGQDYMHFQALKP
jgi:hypothetical protein